MDAPPNFPHRRKFTRVRLPITALVTVNGETLSLSVHNVSLEGIGLQGAPSLEAGAACAVELRREDAPQAPWIAAHGTVVRAAADVAGIHFLDLVGVDSLQHLRALIMYHAEDPDRVLAEFNAHWGLRPKQC